MALSKSDKLNQHLTLLKQEYAKLQERHNELEQKYSVVAATSGKFDSFASRLLTIITGLYKSHTYSDITIRLSDHVVPAHKLVLNARSDLFNDDFLSDKSELDWADIDLEVAEPMLLWIYTNKTQPSTDEVTMRIMRKAKEFQLIGLLENCEQALISSVTVRTCVKFYSIAEEIGAKWLREYCSGLISTHWDDLTAMDFEHMSGPLLYNMLKGKTTLPLHAAVRLQREDVVFLCLVENSARLSELVDLWGPSGDLPLDLALKARNASIANTLVQHNADVNMRDQDGATLLHRAIQQRDTFAAQFLLDHNCDATLTTRAENESALHLLAQTIDVEESVNIGEKLIVRNVGVNSQNRHGLTALHLAIMADNEPIVNLLLQQRNIEVNLRTNDQQHPPLYYALIKHDHVPDYAQRLIDKGAETSPIYAQNGEQSLLQLLIDEGREDAALHLVEHVHNLDYANAAGETALHTACTRACAPLVRRLLALGANGNRVTHESRRTPLHHAVVAVSEACVRAFIESNRERSAQAHAHLTDFNVRDDDGETLLSLALLEGARDLVPVLIEGGADVNVRNASDFTLLHQAILNEDAATAIFLLDNGADMNAKTAEYESPLQLAIHCRLSDVVNALCLRGVDLAALDKAGNCPLWAALESKQDEIASVLVRHGVDTDCWGPGPDNCRQTLLHRAIDENKEAAAIFLIQSGCDLNAPRAPGANGEGGEEANDRQSPLHLCCQWGLETVVQTLVEHGANVNARNAENKTPLHVAIENQHSNIIAILLCVPNIDLALRDRTGLSPFATALTYRNNKAAQSILDKMPTAAEQSDSKGYNFLHTAITKGDVESVLFLLSVHVDVNSRVHDANLTTPLHLAARFSDEMLVRSLILAGARIDDSDAHRQTALHVAAMAGNAPACAALIQNHIDYDACDINGDNALHIAAREGHLSVVKALLTESHINAEHKNIKGCNPLHVLCRYGRENAATICEFFLECMPDYPINKPDLDGNTPLLLAYMKGNGNLCRTLVKANACLAAENNDRVTIFNYQVASKQLLHRLLDQLAKQVPWTQTDLCQECGKGFTLTVRKHHCRHCGRVLCSKCSDQETPIIKFGENKPVRVCKVCYDVLQRV